ncbi:MAG: 2-dehydropantoate 2-reductase N-terminal domain-containing protein [Myxococcota bacterium]
MRIAVVGPGRIGSTFAFLLARAGHQLTVVARGQRLQQLRRDQGILTEGGARAALEIAEALDPTIPWDLVLVTVLSPQVDAILPQLAASSAKTILFMFNTFEPLDRLRAAVGAERFAFGFPSMLAHLEDGRLKYQVYTIGQITTVTDARWAKVFSEAGIGTVVEADMHAWLRTHAAFVAPFMAISVLVHQRGAGLRFGEALRFARAWRSGFAVVRALGHRLRPWFLEIPSRVPSPILAMLFWALSRLGPVREAGALGPGEARMIIDQMTAAAPGQTEDLLAIRP